ncbi:MAG: hypothetical protein AB1861_17575 [Cyanobacteriota bacterium]
MQKPITTQVFRREHKNDTWYVHLTTYVSDIPTVHTKKNGYIGKVYQSLRNSKTKSVIVNGITECNFIYINYAN